MSTDQPNNSFIQQHAKYDNLIRKLKAAKIDAVMKKGYNINSAKDLVEGINSAKYASKGLERSPLTNEIQFSMQEFFDSNPGFMLEKQRLYQIVKKKVERENPMLRGNALTRAIREANKEFLQLRPTQKNKNAKHTVLNELKVLPAMGTYPGGTNYLAAKENFNKAGGKSNARKTHKKKTKQQKRQ